MNRILIRFNTRFQDDELKRTWRVLINGQEYLAENVQINIPCETLYEPVDGVPKWHFLCHGVVLWENNKAIINK
jgi:hypothetical protein